MTNLAKDFRMKLARLARIGQPEIEAVQTSWDTTKKILFRLEDGLFIESVLIPAKVTGPFASQPRRVAA